MKYIPMRAWKKDVKSWVDKYDPTLQDVIAPQELIQTISKSIEIKRPINLNLFGRASGVGKTSLAKAYAKALNYHLLMLSGGSVGKDAIQNDVTLAVQNQQNICILMDEADNITTGAEGLLKPLVETYSDATYIITSNYNDKIDLAFRNRFVAINYDKMMSAKKNRKELLVKLTHRMCWILTNEGISFNEDDVISMILDFFPKGNYPQIRQMIHNLEFHSVSGTFKYNDCLPWIFRNRNEKDFIEIIDLMRKGLWFKDTRPILNQIDVREFMYFLNDNFDIIFSLEDDGKLIRAVHQIGIYIKELPNQIDELIHIEALLREFVILGIEYTSKDYFEKMLFSNKNDNTDDESIQNIKKATVKASLMMDKIQNQVEENKKIKEIDIF